MTVKIEGREGQEDENCNTDTFPLKLPADSIILAAFTQSGIFYLACRATKVSKRKESSGRIKSDTKENLFREGSSYCNTGYECPW
jgi:hypothetical protein